MTLSNGWSLRKSRYSLEDTLTEHWLLSPGGGGMEGGGRVEGCGEMDESGGMKGGGKEITGSSTQAI